MGLLRDRNQVQMAHSIQHVRDVLSDGWIRKFLRRRPRGPQEIPVRQDVLEEIAEATRLPEGWSRGLRGPDRMRVNQRRLSVHVPASTQKAVVVARVTYQSVPYGGVLVYCGKCGVEVERRLGCPRPVCGHSLHNTNLSGITNTREEDAESALCPGQPPPIS